MTDVICDMQDCKHRSKRPMRKYKKRSGKNCYKCKLNMIHIKDEAIQEIYEQLEQELPCCMFYEKKISIPKICSS